MSFRLLSSKGYLHETNIPTYFFQDSLPKIPIPALEDTIERYLASAKPLLSDKEFEVTSSVARDFLAWAREKN